MARIAGVDLPLNKRVEIGLTYIFGIGRTSAQQVCEGVQISRDTRVRDLTEEEVAIRDFPRQRPFLRESEELAAGGKTPMFVAVDGVSLEIPPLRERPEDILLLAEHFMAELAREYGRRRKTFEK